MAMIQDRNKMIGVLKKTGWVRMDRFGDTVSYRHPQMPFQAISIQTTLQWTHYDNSKVGHLGGGLLLASGTGRVSLEEHLTLKGAQS